MESIYLSLHCHHQNDFCIKKGSDESHFNASLIVRDKVTRPCPQTITFLKRKESQSDIQPRSFRLPAYHLTARPNQLSSVRCRIPCDCFWPSCFVTLFWCPAFRKLALEA